MTKEWTDSDGDTNLGIEVKDLFVFATDDGSGNWTVNFGLSCEVNDGLKDDLPWAETLTGRGAFATIRLIRPAVKALLEELDRRNAKSWGVCCDSRRAKLYSRYLPKSKIRVTG